jgi:DNA-binding transcriptional ArsR family regulator
MDANILLDKSTFKALASETRVEVLKLLKQRRHMQSELATELHMAVPTVKEHLDALEKAGLVIRYEEGRKWKYYGLTSKGKAILDPEQKRIWIVLAALVFSVIGSVVNFFRAKSFGVGGPVEAMNAPVMELKAAPAAEMMTSVASPTTSSLPLFFGVATIVLLILLIYLLIKRAQWQAQLRKLHR